MQITRPLFRPLAALFVSMASLTSAVTAEGVDEGMTTLRGELFYRERIAPLPGSIATITLNDISRADAPAIRVAQLTLSADRIPVSFVMGVATDRLNDGARYGLRGTITDPDGALLWTTDTAYLIDAAQDVNDLGMMRLVRVAQEHHEDTATRATFLCGDRQVQAQFLGETAALEIDGKGHRLTQVRAASGARYEDPAGGLMFWDRGGKAVLKIGDAAPVECTRVEQGRVEQGNVEQDRAGQPALMGGKWLVEDIDGRGVVDNSQTSLTFAADNRLSGRAGCNSYTGSYSVTGNSLSIDGVAVTSMACLPALADQEAAFLDILNGLLSFRFSDTGALLLSDGMGRQITAQR